MLWLVDTGRFFFLKVSRKKPFFLVPQRYKNPSILLHLVPGPHFLSALGFPLSISIRVPLSHTHHLPSRPDRIYLVLESLLAVRSNQHPYYVNTERDYERDYQATLPQGRTAADGCKPRHGREDRKRERSFSGLCTENET